MEQIERARLQIFQALTRVQHREYGPMVAEFRSALDSDPFFTSKARLHSHQRIIHP
jgi:hypothetical protein